MTEESLRGCRIFAGLVVAATVWIIAVVGDYGAAFTLAIIGSIVVVLVCHPKPDSERDRPHLASPRVEASSQPIVGPSAEAQRAANNVHGGIKNVRPARHAPLEPGNLTAMLLARASASRGFRTVLERGPNSRILREAGVRGNYPNEYVQACVVKARRLVAGEQVGTRRFVDFGHSHAQGSKRTHRGLNPSGAWTGALTFQIGNAMLGAPEHGLLSAMGYRVGKSRGLPKLQRRAILDKVMAANLVGTNHVGSNAYLAQWGVPQSQQRLRKTAECLANFTRLKAGVQNRDFSVAISQWESDLAYLKRKYYHAPRNRFVWPRSGV